MALPDCGPEDEIRRTEALAREQDEREVDEQAALGVDLDENDTAWQAEQQEREDQAGYNIESGRYTPEDARIARLPTIDEESVLCPEQGLEFSRTALSGSDLIMGYDEETETILYSDVAMEAEAVNKYGDDIRTAGPMIGIRISFGSDTNGFISSPSAEAIFLPKDDAAAHEIIGAAKMLLTRGEPKKETEAVALFDALKQFATSNGVNVVDSPARLRQY